MRCRVMLRIALVFAAGCSSPPEPATPTDAAGAGPVAARAVPIATGEAEPPPEDASSLAPAPAPGDVVVHLRWRSPLETVTDVVSFAAVPDTLVQRGLNDTVRETIESELYGLVDGARFAEAVALDAPIDVVVVAATRGVSPMPEPIWAASIGLSSFARARDAAKERPQRVAPGVWAIGAIEELQGGCVIATAAGRAPARLVCSESMTHAVELAPYLARTLAAEPDAPVDVRLSLRLRPMLDKHGSALAKQAQGLPIAVVDRKRGLPRFDEALLDAATALADDLGLLIQDLDGATIDLDADAKGLRLDGRIALAGKRSWTVQTLLGGADRAGPAPDLFWRLPRDARIAAWGPGADTKRLAPVVSTLSTLLEGALELEKVGQPADRQALVKLLQLPTSEHATTALAYGGFGDAPRSGSRSALLDYIDDLYGWQLYGVESPAAPIRAWLQDAVAVYNRPNLNALARQAVAGDLSAAPIVKRGTPPAGLGAGALAIEITFPGVQDDFAAALDPSGATQATSLDVQGHVLLMADGNRTWIGASTRREDLVKLMLATKTRGPATLEGRASFARLAQGTHSAGVVTTFRGLLDTARPGFEWFLLMAGGEAIGRQILDLVGKMPNKGETPMTLLYDVTDGPRPTLRFGGRIDAESLQDAGWLVARAIAVVENAGKQP